MKFPDFQNVKAWPPEVQKSLMELIAFTVNDNADVMTFSIHQAKTPEKKLGSWEIRVTKIDD